MVVNQSFYICNKTMFPSINIPNQQYFFFPTPNMQFSPFFNSFNQTFVMPHSNFQNGLNYVLFGQNMHLPPQNEPLMVNTPQLNQNSNVQAQQPHQNKDIKNQAKEKLIRKLANRPATYLTQRKFYLAQKLPESSHLPRKLRQRILKKKHSRTLQSSANIAYRFPPTLTTPVNEEDKNIFAQQEESPAIKISRLAQNQLLESLDQERVTLPQNEKGKESISQSDDNS